MKKLVGTILFLAVVSGACGPVYGANNERSPGIIEITDFQERRIPLYREPGGKAFETLVFAERVFDVGPGLEFFMENGSRFLVFRVKQGWNAASQAAMNASYYANEDMLRNIPGTSPRPAHVLQFAILGDPEAEWLKVVHYQPFGAGTGININGSYIGIVSKAPGVFFIKRDDAYMRYVAWEDLISRERLVNVQPDTPVYDGPDGKLIEKPFAAASAWGVQIEGDWAQGWFFRSDMDAFQENYHGWFRWHAADGQLLVHPADRFIGPPLI